MTRNSPPCFSPVVALGAATVGASDTSAKSIMQTGLGAAKKGTNPKKLPFYAA